MMNGNYNTKDFKKPLVDFGLEIQNIDINSTFKTFSTIKALGATGNTIGKISSTLILKASLISI